MANEIIPYQMSKCLGEIHRLRALIEWRCTRDDIRVIHEPLKADIARLRAAVDALDRAFQGEKDKPNGTGPAGTNANKLWSMPSRGDNKRRLSDHEIATLPARRTNLVSALRAYMETNDRPFWWIATEIGVAKSALRHWQNGKIIPKSESLDRIERFLEWQKYAGRSSAQILNAFRRFYCETSLSDYAIARMIGVGPGTIPFWVKGIRTPQLANLRKIDRFMEKYGSEYLRA
jgi:hypothetical protein